MIWEKEERPSYVKGLKSLSHELRAATEEKVDYLFCAEPWKVCYERLSGNFHGFDRPYCLRYKGCRLIYDTNQDRMVLIAIDVGYGHDVY